MQLTREEILQYQRQYLLEEFGVNGQLKLKQARIAVIGAGGLGSPLLLYLAAAGIGFIKVIDFDRVEVHNLHRQILFTHADLGQLKAETAVSKLRLHNPNIELASSCVRLDATNAAALLEDVDLVIDGCDNFETRYAVNDACIALGKTLVSGAIYKFEGQVAVFNHLGGPSYRDLFPNQTASTLLSCSVVGVMGSTCAVIAGFMSNEVIKLLTGLGKPLAGVVLQVNLLNMEINQFKI